MNLEDILKTIDCNLQCACSSFANDCFSKKEPIIENVFISRDIGQITISNAMVSYPCVLYDIDDIKYEQLSRKNLLANATLKVRVIYLILHVEEFLGVKFYDFIKNYLISSDDFPNPLVLKSVSHNSELNAYNGTANSSLRKFRGWEDYLMKFNITWKEEIKTPTKQNLSDIKKIEIITKFDVNI